MRHKKSGRKLGRSAAHRKALFRNMAKALVTHERIRTTEAKAKELRKVVDGLVTLALKNDVHARRQAFKVLENHQLVAKLFDEIGPRFKEVPGGYTRVVKLSSPRVGDNAAMAVIELTRLDGEESPEAPKKKAKPAKKAEAKAAPAEEAPAEEAAAEEAPAEEAPAEEAPAEEAPAEEAAAEEAPAEEAAAEEAPAEEAPKGEKAEGK